MSDTRHVSGPTVSVLADDDGCVLCGCCLESTVPTDVYMLIGAPGLDHWIGLCRQCARQAAVLLASNLDSMPLS